MKKLIRHIPILGMSMYRENALKAAKSNSETLANHIVKCVVYQNTTGDLKHWVEDEICEYLSIVNDITVKPKDRKLKKNDYLSTIFSDMGDTEADAGIVLRNFRIENKRSKKYPEFDVTLELIQSVYHAFQAIISGTLPILLSKNSRTTEDFYDIVYKAVHPR